MAYEAYMLFKGEKSGQIKGSVTRSGGSWIGVIQVSIGVVSPRDASTGQASGRRVHSPIHIVKEWGASSPSLFQAYATNELLDQVVIEFVRDTPQNREYVYQTFTLRNVVVSNIEWSGPRGGSNTYERLLLNYGEIDWNGIPRASSDDWLRQALPGGHGQTAVQNPGVPNQFIWF